MEDRSTPRTIHSCRSIFILGDNYGIRNEFDAVQMTLLEDNLLPSIPLHDNGEVDQSWWIDLPCGETIMDGNARYLEGRWEEWREKKDRGKGVEIEGGGGGPKRNHDKMEKGANYLIGTGQSSKRDGACTCGVLYLDQKNGPKLWSCVVNCKDSHFICDSFHKIIFLKTSQNNKCTDHKSEISIVRIRSLLQLRVRRTFAHF